MVAINVRRTAFTEREIDRVRIISARRAARQELHDYEENVQT